MNKLFTDIPNYETFIKIDEVTEGMSGDKKYFIETSDGQDLLLRIADMTEYDRKKNEYNRMELMDSAGVPMSRPVNFGICNDGKTYINC